MSVSTPSDSRISAESFAEHCNGQMIPIKGSLSYFSVIPLDDHELQRLIYDPVAVIPPRVSKILPRLRLVITAYLEKAEDKDGSAVVTFSAPPESRRIFSTVVENGGDTFLFLGVKDEDIADTHDAFYEELAELIVDRGGEDIVEPFYARLRDELKGEIRGELDDKSWKLKEAVLRRQSDPTRKTKLTREYFRQAMADTLTLYLHGLCCDIDVEAGPRQLASRHIRKRLTLLRELLPPPQGIPLFPEEIPPES